MLPLTQSVRADHFRLMITKCPAGYVLVNADLDMKEDFLVCECDYDNPDVVDCDGTTILLPVSLFIAFVRGIKLVMSLQFPNSRSLDPKTVLAILEKPVSLFVCQNVYYLEKVFRSKHCRR